jgi:hypothetical protein
MGFDGHYAESRLELGRRFRADHCRELFREAD